MRSFFLKWAGILGCLVFFLSACRKAQVTSQSREDTVLADVGPESITIEDFQKAMLKRPVGEDEFSRMVLLEEMIEFRLLVQEAKERGYDENPEFLEAVDRLLANMVREENLHSAALRPEISDEEIETYYRDNASEFEIPSKIRAAMIFIEAPAGFTSEKRAELRARIVEARAKAITNPGSFSGLAAEYSYDQNTKFRGGDIGYLLAGMDGDGVIEPEVVKAAFSLKEPGQIGEILETGRGFYLLRLTEIHRKSQHPLSKVRGRIRSKLVRNSKMFGEKMISAGLRDGKTIKIHRDRLIALPESPFSASQSASPPPVPDR